MDIEDMLFVKPIIKAVTSLLEKPALKQQYDEAWYFSPEGKRAYESLSTQYDKTHFFLNYLRSATPETYAKDWHNVTFLYRIAFVMSNSMVDSQLEFGGYPNIIDESKNPLVYYVKYKESESLEYLLSLLHYNNSDKSDSPYGPITFCKENEPVSDLYKIERDIILIFDGLNWTDRERISSLYSRALDYMVKNSDDMNFETDLVETEQDLEDTF